MQHALPTAAQGEILTFSGGVLWHGAAKVQAGRRYVLAGFVRVREEWEGLIHAQVYVRSILCIFVNSRMVLMHVQHRKLTTNLCFSGAEHASDTAAAPLQCRSGSDNKTR